MKTKETNIMALASKACNIWLKVAPYVTSAILLLACIAPYIAFADGAGGGAGGGITSDYAGFMTALINVVAKAAIAFGIFLSVMGAIHYASANSEGDGPAKHKAVAQIASGVMVIIVAIAISVVDWSQYLGQ